PVSPTTAADDVSPSPRRRTLAGRPPVVGGVMAAEIAGQQSAGPAAEPGGGDAGPAPENDHLGPAAGSGTSAPAAGSGASGAAVEGGESAVATGRGRSAGR